MEDNQPNVLLMMCDQLNASVLGTYGGPVPTPNLDRIADGGVVFTDATCPTPFCSPSRASLITGLYPHSHGIVTNVNRRDYPAIPAPPTEEGIKETDATTERVLNAAGYDTHHYGKWHLLDDDLSYYPDMYAEHGAYAEEMADVFGRVRERPREEWMDWYGWALPVTTSPALEGALRAYDGNWRDHQYAEFVGKMGRLDLPLEQDFNVRIADKTIERLRVQRSGPFMLTCSFNYPHDPNVVPSPYYDAFDPAEIELPANYDCLEARFGGEWSRQIVTDLGDDVVREFLRIYYASCRLVDDQVGRILDELEAMGQLDNTLVVFTADHGDMAGGHGMVWKSTSAFYDEVARVPLLMRYPSRFPEKRADMGASLTDMAPTILDVCGHLSRDHSSDMQGTNLAPYLDATRPASEAPIFTFSERLPANPGHTRDVGTELIGNFMVRGKGWKHVVYRDGKEFLYSLVDDPGETCNLADDPAHARERSMMLDALATWLDATECPEPGLPEGL